MIPSKRIRHKMYKAALLNMQTHEMAQIFGLCYHLRQVQLKSEYCKYDDPYNCLSVYPEIYGYKPYNYSKDSWFFPKDEEGFMQRLVILDNAITLTKP